MQKEMLYVRNPNKALCLREMFVYRIKSNKYKQLEAPSDNIAQQNTSHKINRPFTNVFLMEYLKIRTIPWAMVRCLLK